MSAETSGSPSDELGHWIAVGASQLGVPLSTGQIERLVGYLRLIERWNATYNLTAVRDANAMVSGGAEGMARVSASSTSAAAPVCQG